MHFFESLTIALTGQWCCFPEPEVPGHFNKYNCTTLQFAGKFTLAHISRLLLANYLQIYRWYDYYYIEKQKVLFS
jgi:hypothetical protein